MIQIVYQRENRQQYSLQSIGHISARHAIRWICDIVRHISMSFASSCRNLLTDRKRCTDVRSGHTSSHVSGLFFRTMIRACQGARDCIVRGKSGGSWRDRGQMLLGMHSRTTGICHHQEIEVKIRNQVNPRDCPELGNRVPGAVYP